LKEKTTKLKNIEFHNIDFLNNKRIKPVAFLSLDLEIGKLNVGIPSLETLYCIKRSHAHRQIGFSKNIIHLNKMKEHVHLSEEDIDFLKERTKLTNKEFPEKKHDFNVKNEDFFTSNVHRIYDHDFLHKIVAFNERPVYEMMKEDLSLAKCEKHLWDKLPYINKIQAVKEEAMVIALERFVIPYSENYRLAFFKSLEKICTTLTSGWFRDFAIDNWQEIVYDLHDYVSVFEKVKLNVD
jgi:hypothetical protein